MASAAQPGGKRRASSAASAGTLSLPDAPRTRRVRFRNDSAIWDRTMRLSPAGVDFRPADLGQHLAVHQLLLNVFHYPPLDTFLEWTEAPGYQVQDRLVAVHGTRLVGHVHLVRRQWQGDGETVPVVHLAALATLAQYRRQGIGTALVEYALKQARADKAQLAVVRAAEPQFFLRRGWLAVHPGCGWRITPRDLLAQLPPGAAPTASPWQVRPWRQLELGDLDRLYRQLQQHTPGAACRDEAYWRWLVHCRPWDEVLVAVRPPELPKTDEENAPVPPVPVDAYLVRQENRIVELVADPQCPQAAQALLHRAASDAIERDQHWLEYWGPPLPVVQEVFSPPVASPVEPPETMLVFPLLPIQRWLRRRGKPWAARLRRLGSEVTESGLALDGERFRLRLQGGRLHLEQAPCGRSYLRCSPATLLELAWGMRTLEQAVQTGAACLSTAKAQQFWQAVLPSQRFWTSTLDHPQG